MDLSEFLSRLSREPDLDAPELKAFDATDELLLAQELVGGPIVVIGDRHGALALGAAALGHRGIRVHQDPLLSERALRANGDRLGLGDRYEHHPLGESLLAGARCVLVQLPRGLDALDEIAWHIARWAAPDARVYAGGRVKHMTLAQNEVLGRHFTDVRAGLAHRKSRVLTATGAVRDPGAAPHPKWGGDPDLAFRIAAHGATFGGPRLDHGSRLLLRTLHEHPPVPEPARIVDLGCGNGSLAVSAALAWPAALVIATDQSAAAVASTGLTAEAAGVSSRVEVHRADATEAVPAAWADLILLNPPFHSGSTVHAGVAHRLIRSCARALASGGELRLVFNSHLRYRPLIEREIGPVAQLARDKTFTVLGAKADSRR